MHTFTTEWCLVVHVTNSGSLSTNDKRTTHRAGLHTALKRVMPRAARMRGALCTNPGTLLAGPKRGYQKENNSTHD